MHTSGRDTVLDRAPEGPSLVVATPGAEPPAPAGYGTVLLLDGWAMLSRPDLRAAEETLRRWIAAAALARPAAEGGTVVVTGEAGLPAVQALIAWNPAGFAERELAERRALTLPPAVPLASVTGGPDATGDVRTALAAADPAPELLGPVELPEGGFRLLVRAGGLDRAALARLLRQVHATRTARKAPGSVRVQVDPLELL